MRLRKFTDTSWYRFFLVGLGIELICDLVNIIWQDRVEEPGHVWVHPLVHTFNFAALDVLLITFSCQRKLALPENPQLMRAFKTCRTRWLREDQ